MMSGCFGPVVYGIKRGVVHDDWVYVKEDNTLYRRYIPKGIRLPGNENLISKVGSISHKNDRIVVYENYQSAEKELDGFLVDDDSVNYIPTQTSEDSSYMKVKNTDQ